MIKMKSPNIFLSLIIFMGAILILSGCQLSVISQPTVAPVQTSSQEIVEDTATAPILPSPTTPAEAVTDTPPTQATPSPQATDLSVEMVLNSTYTLTSYSEAKDVQLQNGTYDSGSDTDRISVRMLNPILITDLNHDSWKDAAVIVAENYGGSGVFMSLVVYLNQAGKSVQGGSIFIDDRAEILALQALDSQILLEARVHGIGDAMCCPTFHVLRTYQLSQSKIILVSQSSKTPGGVDRVISIESPVDGETVSGSVQVRGTVTISPFENNLAISFVDSTGTELWRGPFQVISADIGAPGTFDNPVDLSVIPAGTTVRLVLSEFSMADGSLITMDSVEIHIK